jgi:signal transduction histidine kinase
MSIIPSVLHEFIISHRDGISARTNAKLITRTAPGPTEAEPALGVRLFCDQLVETLRLSCFSSAAIKASAVSHGEEMQRQGFTVGQVVHQYGDICQAITELAREFAAPITVDEFHTMNCCLAEGTERFGFLAHEIRNHAATAMLSLDLLRSEAVDVDGSTGIMLQRSLASLRDLVARSLVEVRLESATERFELVAMVEFIGEVEVAAAVEARARGLQLTIEPVPPGVAVEADRHLLGSAVANLLQNAFKFTRVSGSVTLKTHASAGRVLIEVEDECGGLPPGNAEELFRPFKQRSGDRSGLGLGLSISRRAAKANRGDIRVRSLPGKGCVFTIDLPRLPALT